MGEESEFRFDLRENMKNGRSFKDAICPDSMEFKKDHFIMSGKYGRVLFLKEYASYIKDSMINELTSLNRSLMLSIDIIPVPTDEGGGGRMPEVGLLGMMARPMSTKLAAPAER